ncbi:hypothetical protein TSOC_014738, partial [Tetrabaena socialis]
QAVPRQQRVMGVDFCYQPPPRSVVPCAAALKGQPDRAPHAHVRSGRDEYGGYSPSSGGGGGGYLAPIGSYPPPSYGTMSDPYGGTASYIMAPVMPPSPGRGGHMDMTFAPYGMTRGEVQRGWYDMSVSAGGSSPYGSRMSGGSGGGHPYGGPNGGGGGPPSSGKAPPSMSSSSAYGGGGGGMNGGGGGGGMGMSYMAMGPMGPIGPLDPSGMGMAPLPLPPGSPQMALLPGGGQLSLPPGTDMAALTDYMMKTGG